MTFLTADSIEVGYRDNSTGIAKTVCQLSFEIEEGEIIGLTGVSGSGKTTLLRAIVGFIAPFRGSVTWTHGSSRAVAYCPQEDVLLDYRSVWENAVLLLESPRIAQHKLSEHLNFVADAIERVNLSQERRWSPGELSGGMRQRLQVVQALAAPSQLTLLDEPFSQQDQDHQHTLEDLSWGAMRQHHRAAVIVSHDVDALTAVCDRIVFLGGSPARAVKTIKTPPSLAEVGGAVRRRRPEFPDFAATLWQARSEAALT